MTAPAFWPRLLAELDAGHAVFLAWVVDHSEHSPGTRGARLFLSASGARAGTIGGGIMEKKLEVRAAQLLAAPGPAFFERRTLHHSREADGERSGMICAGRQTNLALLLRPDRDRGAVAALVERLERDAPGYLVLGPGGVALAETAEAAEGEYREPLQNPRRIAIFGGGHCGQALARQMALLGYEVLLIETRSAVLPADPEQLGPGVLVQVAGDFREAAAAVARPEQTVAVVMTTDFPNDVRALEGALRQPFPFLGLMGSPAKLEEIRARLLTLGFGEQDLARLEAPVGLAIGSRTPPEIAVSIAARILEWRAGR